MNNQSREVIDIIAPQTVMEGAGVKLGFSFAKYTNSRKPSAGGHFVH